MHTNISELRVSGILVLLILLCAETFSQEAFNSPVTIMFYNTGNFFHPSDDPLTDDDEFTPDGVMRWTESRYRKKISAVYRAIVAAGGWSPPSVVAFCEVESRKVLDDLIYDTYLSKYNYSVIHRDSPDRRGIDVCLIYRKDILDVLSYSWHYLKDTAAVDYPTREILYARFKTGDDTLHVIVNHWPSRRGGVLAAAGLRDDIMKTVRVLADSISCAHRGRAKIIITGDFNAVAGDRVMQDLVKGVGLGGVDYSPRLVNLSDGTTQDVAGTYRYRGLWETIDQFIVSGWILECESGLAADSDSFTVVSQDFLLEKDPLYPGVSPFATYRGYSYQGGYSDHLPVMLEMTVRPDRLQE
jgi:hypothetical protein